MFEVLANVRDHLRMIVGLISDTHGLIRSQALAALRGSDIVIHAGDIGSNAVLDSLGKIAPVFAVRGNNDRGPWAQVLPVTETVTVGNRVLYVLHDLKELDIDPTAAGFAVVISGHSHKPKVERRGEVLYVNPGSAGPRRFKLPLAVGRLHVTDDELECELIEIDDG